MLQRGEGDFEINVLKQRLELHLCTLIALHVHEYFLDKNTVQYVAGVIWAYVYANAEIRLKRLLVRGRPLIAFIADSSAINCGFMQPVSCVQARDWS